MAAQVLLYYFDPLPKPLDFVLISVADCQALQVWMTTLDIAESLRML